MCVTRFTFFPNTGNSQDLRSYLEHWVKGSPARGVQASLTTRLFAEAACFTIGMRHENLGVYERYVQGRNANPEFQLFSERLMRLLSRASTSELYEEVSAYPSDLPHPRYLQRIIHHPALGMDAELQRLLVEWAQSGMHTDGVGEGRSLGRGGGAAVQHRGARDGAAVGRQRPGHAGGRAGVAADATRQRVDDAHAESVQRRRGDARAVDARRRMPPTVG